MIKTILLKAFLIATLLVSFKGSKSQIVLPGPEIRLDDAFLLYRAANNFLKDSTVTIILKTNLLHPEIQGITQQIHEKLYCIDISDRVNRDKTMRKWVILHEMGHVLDLHAGKLAQTPPRWMGKKINSHLPWELRPWEQAADDWAFIMWGALIDEIPPFIIFTFPEE